MNTQHTPGPWTVNHYPSGLVIRPNKGAAICEVSAYDSAGRNVDPDRNYANAALIAAAPDLLAALRAMLEDYRSEGCPDPTCGVCERSNAAKAVALAAIAKAERGIDR
jgi:hypothetical protein